MITVHINGTAYEAAEGSSILEVCRMNNIYVPSLCHHPEVPSAGQCGLCIVRVDGASFAHACSTKAKDRMDIDTKSPDVVMKAKKNLEKIIDEPLPPRYPEIEEAYQYFYPKERVRLRRAEKTNSITYDPDDCVISDRCIRVCSDVVGVSALDDPTLSLKRGPCIGCGQCTYVCPTKAYSETSSIHKVLRAMAKGSQMILLVSPSSSLYIGQDRVASMSRQLGFSKVYSSACGVELAADVEADELISRLGNEGRKPLFNTTCPAFVNFIEKSHPELIGMLSRVKTPHQLLSTRIREDSPNIHIVSLSNCVAQKDEIHRMQLSDGIDTAITTREFLELTEMFKIDKDFSRPSTMDQPYDSPSQEAISVDSTGGITKCVVSKAYKKLTGGQPLDFSLTSLPEYGRISAGSFFIPSLNRDITFCCCDGMSAAITLIETGNFFLYDYIEVMSCRGGCAGGGGRPKNTPIAPLPTSIFSLTSPSIERPLAFSLPRSKVLTHFEPQESQQLSLRKQLKTNIVVAYGSVNGSTTQFARILASFLSAPSVPLNSLTSAPLKPGSLIVVLTATTNEGSAPPNAQKLLSSSRDFSSTHFCVCGFGSHEYSNFCGAANTLFNHFASHNSVSLFQIHKVDTNTLDRGEAGFQRFMSLLASTLGLVTPSFGLITKFTTRVLQDRLPLMRPTGFEYANIIEKTKISDEPPVTQYLISLPPGMSYKAGEHIQILPQNEPERVSKVIESLKLDPDMHISVKALEDTSPGFIPERVSIRELFSQYVDLSGPVTRSLIAFFDPLSNLLSDPKAMHEFQIKTDVSEYLVKQSAQGLDKLLSVLPMILPRTYSIASSPGERAGELIIIVSAAVFNGRMGLGSRFLLNAERIPLRITSGVFDIPPDDTPLILCGLGSGLAPSMGILQHRQKIGGNLGKTLVMFGAKYRGAFPLLLRKLQRFLDDGTISVLMTAFSRDNSPFKHVQDRMREKPEEIWRIWSDPRAVFYYCGPPRGIFSDIRETLIQICEKEGHMGREEAIAFTAAHKFVVEAY